jgi:hypothetical protein
MKLVYLTGDTLPKKEVTIEAETAEAILEALPITAEQIMEMKQQLTLPINIHSIALYLMAQLKADIVRLEVGDNVCNFADIVVTAHLPSVPEAPVEAARESEI